MNLYEAHTTVNDQSERALEHFDRVFQQANRGETNNALFEMAAGLRCLTHVLRAHNYETYELHGSAFRSELRTRSLIRRSHRPPSM